MTTAAEIYELLKFDAPDETLLTRRDTEIEIADSFVAHAIDASGRHALVVPLTEDDKEVNDHESRGLSFDTFVTNAPAPGSRVLIIRCLEQQLSSQFGLLVDDIARALADNSVRPGDTCLAVLRRWRALFAGSDESLLPIGQQIGLIAELHLLEALVRQDRRLAFDFWRGPDRARHDFVSEHAAIEVKATLHRDQLLIAVHGALQLERPAVGELFLLVEQLELSPYGESLPMIVNRILGLGVDAQSLLSAVSKAGYRHQDATQYLGFKYAVLRNKICLVDAAFPRLVKESLVDQNMIDRFVRIEYVVDVGPIAPIAPDREAMQAAAQRIFG